MYDERFPALFSLDVYASLIGMFELNNLGQSRLGPASSALIIGSPSSRPEFAAAAAHHCCKLLRCLPYTAMYADLNIESPLEAYFVLLEQQQDEPAMQQRVAPWKHQVEEVSSLNDCCQGTGFYALHSCLNHSCVPNVKIHKCGDGKAVVETVQTVQLGEELVVSYVDEDLPFEERQEALAHYGFSCSCTGCQSGI